MVRMWLAMRRVREVAVEVKDELRPRRASICYIVRYGRLWRVRTSNRLGICLLSYDQMCGKTGVFQTSLKLLPAVMVRERVGTEPLPSGLGCGTRSRNIARCD